MPLEMHRSGDEILLTCWVYSYPLDEAAIDEWEPEVALLLISLSHLLFFFPPSFVSFSERSSHGHNPRCGNSGPPTTKLGRHKFASCWNCFQAAVPLSKLNWTSSRAHLASSFPFGQSDQPLSTRSRSQSRRHPPPL